MATLTVNGKQVKVDDSFLSLSPQQQEATVNEIAASMGGAEHLTPGNAPSSPAFDELLASSSAKSKLSLSGQPPVQEQSFLDKIINSTAATANGLVNGIPILGPLAQNATDAMGATVAQLTGGDYGDYVKHQQDLRAKTAQAAPVASLAGNIGGALASFGGLGATATGAEALGITGPTIWNKIGNSFLSSQGIGMADSMARGTKPTDAVTENLLPSAIAGGLPIVGAVARAGGRAVRDNVIRPIATAMDRGNEVTRRLSGAIGQDVASGGVMSSATEAVAQKAGTPIVNADRFGTAIRTLARTASNVSAEADAFFKNLTQDRFHTQGKRAVGFVRQLMGGATDDLALQDALKDGARVANKAAYDLAEANPKARAIWTPEIRRLLTADPMKTAAKAADAAGANRAALTGQKAVRNPFTFDAEGNVTGLRKLPGGGVALPSLEFWDIVQRNLRDQATEAARLGKNTLASEIGQMRTQLLNALDSTVPEFRKARQGAAGFFGAEDAIEAGKKAFTSPKNVPEIERAIAAAKPAERDAMAVGYASEMIDAINASKDRVNVINSIFGSESARARTEAVLGVAKARELEAFVKMEQAVDLLRQATQGNSTTAKQLIAAGLMGGGAGAAGFIGSGGDLTAGLSAAALFAIGRRGMQALGKRVDEHVMKQIAEILASGDPAKLQRAIHNASLSAQHMAALDAINRGLATASRGAVAGAVAATPSSAEEPAYVPPRITVSNPNVIQAR